MEVNTYYANYDPNFDRPPEVGDVVTLTEDAYEKEKRDARESGSTFPPPHRDNFSEAKISKFFGPVGVILNCDLYGKRYRQLEDLTLLKKGMKLKKYDKKKVKRTYEEIKAHEMEKKERVRGAQLRFNTPTKQDLDSGV